VVLPLTFSRSGLALFILSVVVAAVVSLKHRRAAALAAGTLLVFAISTGVNPVTRDRAASAAMTVATLVTGSANTSGQAPRATGQGGVTLDDNRKYLVAAGVNMFVDHPVTGVGFGGYQHQLVTNYKRYLPPNFVNPDTVSHTAFVTVAAEEGVIGLALLLAFLAWLGVEAFRSRRSVWVQVPMVLMVPIILYSQFEGRLLEEPYFWLCLALVYAALSRQPANRDAAVSRRLPK
jgi:O-antigen ligase